MQQAPEFEGTKLTIVVWSGEAASDRGHDPRSRYVETYWLGVLGPSTTWLYRHIADQLEASPSGFVMDLDETARCLGVHLGGKNSPFVRALGRLCMFEMAKPMGPSTMAVRRTVPSLSRRHVLRLPSTLQERHDFWQKQQLVTAG